MRKFGLPVAHPVEDEIDLTQSRGEAAASGRQGFRLVEEFLLAGARAACRPCREPTAVNSEGVRLGAGPFASNCLVVHRPSNNAVDRYRSAKDGSTTRMVFPAISFRPAIVSAAATAAPEEMPPGMPS